MNEERDEDEDDEDEDDEDEDDEDEDDEEGEKEGGGGGVGGAGENRAQIEGSKESRTQKTGGKIVDQRRVFIIPKLSVLRRPSTEGVSRTNGRNIL